MPGLNEGYYCTSFQSFAVILFKVSPLQSLNFSREGYRRLALWPKSRYRGNYRQQGEKMHKKKAAGKNGRKIAGINLVAWIYYVQVSIGGRPTR
jgi:hypothetical protein